MITEEFKTIFTEYLEKLRLQSNVTDKQQILAKYIEDLPGNLSSNEENANCIFNKAQELGLSDSDILFCFIALIKKHSNPIRRLVHDLQNKSSKPIQES